MSDSRSRGEGTARGWSGQQGSWSHVLAVLTLLAILSAASPARSQETDQAAVALQRAIRVELVDGDLQAAVALYAEIATRFAADRIVAATALLHLGQCYEKLGEPEARAAYERVQRDYADQAEVAAQAGARLAELAASQSRAAAEGATLQDLALDVYNGHVVLSPDGAQVAYENENGTLVVRDLGSGVERTFGQGQSPVWSPDGTRIAFSRPESYWNYEILIVSVATGEEQHREVNGQPADWSRDGRFILYLDPFGEPPTLNLLPVAGGQPQRIELEWDGDVLAAVRFSPDSRYITYASRHDGDADVYLLPVEGGEPVGVTDDPGNDYDPIWTADGRLLLFLSDRAAGRTDLWGVRMIEATPSGDPFVVRADLGTAQLGSLSDNGRLLLGWARAEYGMYVTAVDPSTQEPVGQPVRLGNRPLANMPNPMWSPDGQQVAYIDTGEDMTALYVIAADGTEDRKVAAGFFNSGPFGWCSDDHIYVQGRTAAGRAIYRISVSASEQELAFRNGEIVGHVACAPDGRRLAFLRGARKPQVYTADVDGNDLRQVTFADEDTTVSFPAWSPNGAELAVSFSGADEGGVMILSLDNGSVREAVSSTDIEHRFYASAWSPDGSRIAWFSRVCQAARLGISRCGVSTQPNSSGDSMSFEIRMSVMQGDQPSQVLPMPRGSVSHPQWSPDGRKMLFTAGQYVARIQLLDNFLPDTDTKAVADGQDPGR